MSKLNEKNERILAAVRLCMDRYQAAFSVLAQGENSPHMTEEFKRRLAEAKERLAPYTISGRAKAT